MFIKGFKTCVRQPAAGDTNLYRNSPTNFTDPSGKFIFAPLLAWAATAAVAGVVGAISGAGFGFGMGAIGSLANDFDNGDLSIDSFGRAFQHGAEGAVEGAKFGFGIGVISTIPIVGNLAISGILAHGAITGADLMFRVLGNVEKFNLLLVMRLLSLPRYGTIRVASCSIEYLG